MNLDKANDQLTQQATGNASVVIMTGMRGVLHQVP